MNNPQWSLPGAYNSSQPPVIKGSPPGIVLQFEPQFGNIIGPLHRVLVHASPEIPLGYLQQYYWQYMCLPASFDGVEFQCNDTTLSPNSTPIDWKMNDGDVIRIYALGQEKLSTETLAKLPLPSGMFRCNFRGCGLLFKEHSDELLRHMNVHYNTQGLFYCSHMGCPLVFTMENELQAHSVQHVITHHPFVLQPQPPSPEKEEAQSSPPAKRKLIKVKNDEADKEGGESAGEESDTTKGFKCDHPGCEESFMKRIELAEHKTIKHVVRAPHRSYVSTVPTRGRTKTESKKKKKEDAPVVNDRPHLCQYPGCGMTFKRGEHLKRHFHSKHSSTTFYKCPVKNCNREFTRKDNRNQHLGRHIRSGEGLKELEEAGLLRHLAGLSPPPKNDLPIERKRRKSNETSEQKILKKPKESLPLELSKSGHSPPSPYPSQNAPTRSITTNAGKPIPKHKKEKQADRPEERSKGSEEDDQVSEEEKLELQDEALMSSSTSPITPKSRRNSASLGTKKLRNFNDQKICSHCLTTESSQWRKSINGERLCNACGLFVERHGRMRMVNGAVPTKAEMKFIQVLPKDDEI